LSKRNVKLILKILSDLESLTGWWNKKRRIQLVRVSIGLFCHSWAFKLPHSCQKIPIYTKTRQIIAYYVMRSKNEVLSAAAGRLAAERSEADKPAKEYTTIFAPNNIYLHNKLFKTC
jgi:hypothetical protein